MGRKRTSGLAAGLASLFCVGVALFQLSLGLQVGGPDMRLPDEYDEA